MARATLVCTAQGAFLDGRIHGMRVHVAGIHEGSFMTAFGRAPGLFITFEGIDGSGKSTQARLLADGLRGLGHQVTLTREPGGSPGAEDIRKLVLEGDPDRWSPEAEILLFTAARRDHLEKTVVPALATGQMVICDRFADSTRVYQGTRRTVTRQPAADPAATLPAEPADLRLIVDRLHALMIGREADLTFVIDIDPATGLGRAKGRKGTEERFEDMGLDMQARLRAGFLALAREFPERCRVIDGSGAVDSVAADVLAVTRAHLAG